MPYRSATSFLAGLRSTPTILSAPTMRAPCTTLRPMPPRPKTTTLEPGSTPAGETKAATPDLARPNHARALHDVKADAPEAENHDVGAGLHTGGKDHSPYPGRHTAADVADRLKGGVLADLGRRDLGQHGVVGERRGAHVMVQGRAEGRGVG